MRQPGPRGLEKLRLLRRLQSPGIVEAICDVRRVYGDTAVVSLPFGRSLHFLNDPDDVMTILVRQARKFVKGKGLETFKLLIGEGVATADGARWLRDRRLALPSFDRRSLESYAAAILNTVEEHRRAWLAAGPGALDLNALLPPLTHDLLARLLLGVTLGPALMPLQQAWGEAMAFVLRRSNAPARLPLAWPLPSHRRFRRNARRIRDAIGRVIASAPPPQGENGPQPFLSRLLDANAALGLDREALIDQILNLLFAGHDTTAYGLSSALYLILAHPPVHARILAEIEEALDGQAAPSHAALARLPLLRKAVYESLRLYPPVSIFVRQALEAVPLSAGVLPKGAIILLSPFVLHRHPRVWRDPERFDPDRFASRALMAPPRFFAFGAGGRTCLGDELAVEAMMLILADLFRALELELDRSEPARLAFTGTLRPAPVRMQARLRRPRETGPDAPAVVSSRELACPGE